MQVYSVQCSCGHVLTTDANSRDEAVNLLKNDMDQEALDKHIDKMHNGGPRPSIQDIHKNIEDQLVQGVLS